MSGGEEDRWVKVRQSTLKDWHERLRLQHQAAAADHSGAEAAERAWGVKTGQDAGREEGRRQALADVARETAADKRAGQAGVDNIPYAGRRWARPGQEFGARETFGQAQPGDYTGGRVDWPGRQPDGEREREPG